MRQNEFEALILDSTKEVRGDIDWSDDEDHSPSVEFRAEVISDAGWPLFVRGSYNCIAETLSYTLVHKGSGRIYALDMGKDHHNPTCNCVGEKHKHRWDEPFRDKVAYVPEDITEPVNRPVEVWKQFCAEAKLKHIGTLHAPPFFQPELI